jgi:hypothetical protein
MPYVRAKRKIGFEEPSLIFKLFSLFGGRSLSSDTKDPEKRPVRPRSHSPAWLNGPERRTLPALDPG